MSDHAVVEHPHAAEEHQHPGPGTYVLIGVILFFLTVLEVAVIYIPAIASTTPLLLTLLMTLMVIKFSLVVMFFMHLKFDNSLFAMLFTAPLLIAASITLALMALFSAFAIGYYGGEVPGGSP